MSGASGSGPCPNCGNDMDTYMDWKPFDTVGGSCIHCGFHYWTQTGYMNLDELNERREDFNNDMGYDLKDDDYLKPLTELPKQEEI